jgi:hypothetical protein
MSVSLHADDEKRRRVLEAGVAADHDAQMAEDALCSRDSTITAYQRAYALYCKINSDVTKFTNARHGANVTLAQAKCAVHSAEAQLTMVTNQKSAAETLERDANAKLHEASGEIAVKSAMSTWIQVCENVHKATVETDEAYQMFLKKKCALATAEEKFGEANDALTSSQAMLDDIEKEIRSYDILQAFARAEERDRQAKQSAVAYTTLKRKSNC